MHLRAKKKLKNQTHFNFISPFFGRFDIVVIHMNVVFGYDHETMWSARFRPSRPSLSFFAHFQHQSF